MPYFRVGCAQVNATVGDFDGNYKKISALSEEGGRAGCQLIVFPEMTVTGYPPEDLLYKKSFIRENLRCLKRLAGESGETMTIVGFAEPSAKGLYNSAAVLHRGRIRAVYRKNCLPNYGVFDEKRYFIAGAVTRIVLCGGVRVGLSICEDIWDKQSFVYQADYIRKLDLLVNISASPYHQGKQGLRRTLLKSLAKKAGRWVVYSNLVGGQDELVFDGGGVVVDPKGNIQSESRLFCEGLTCTDILLDKRSTPATKPLRSIAARLSAEEELYAALVCGTRNYVTKNAFAKVVIGLSGGIDSALVASVAVDALGPSQVLGVTMPSAFNSRQTLADAKLLAKNLGIECLEIPITQLFETFKRTLAPVFQGKNPDSTEENLQARIRGTLLMAFSNKMGHLVLTTGNKSEMATGYCTLYGDMAGGFAVIKDVPKSWVFRLCRWKNAALGRPWIPPSVISRPPSAELRPHQKDSDSLPAYDLLDPILEAYIEKDLSADKIIALGHKESRVLKTLRLVDLSEYKRRQSPPGIKITPRAFGRDRRIPITNRFLGPTPRR